MGTAVTVDCLSRDGIFIGGIILPGFGLMLKALEMGTAGLRVPEDVSVAGFDGIAVDGLGEHVLTTAVQPAVQKGRAAGDAVARLLAGQRAASIRFTCTFREGTTTGPVPRE